VESRVHLHRERMPAPDFEEQGQVVRAPCTVQQNTQGKYTRMHSTKIIDQPIRGLALIFVIAVAMYTWVMPILIQY